MTNFVTVSRIDLIVEMYLPEVYIHVQIAFKNLYM